MLAKVQKWGNSYAVRIPKALVIDAHMENESVVDISLVKGQIIVKPMEVPTWTLESLLAGVTKSNIHHEVDTGAAVGKEAW